MNVQSVLANPLWPPHCHSPNSLSAFPILSSQNHLGKYPTVSSSMGIVAGNTPPGCARCCKDVLKAQESSRATSRSVDSGLHSNQKVPPRMSPFTG